MTDDFLKSILEADPGHIRPTVIVGKDTVLYIYIPDLDHLPTTKRSHYLKMVQDLFDEKLPGQKVIVGDRDLQFTTITEKQAFQGILAGDLEQ